MQRAFSGAVLAVVQLQGSVLFLPGDGHRGARASVMKAALLHVCELNNLPVQLPIIAMPHPP